MNHLHARFSSLFFSLFFLSTFGIYAQKSKFDWNRDAEYLRKSLSQNHVNLFYKFPKDSFNYEIAEFKERINERTDLENAIALEQVIVKCGDDHTSLNFYTLMDDKQRLPFGAYMFDDGLYLLRYPEILHINSGSQITGINGFSLNTISDSLQTLVVNDNPSCLKKSLPYLISMVPILNYFHFAEGNNVTLQIKDSTDNIRNLSIIPGNYETPLNKMKLFSENYSDKDSIYYIEYNKCWSREMEKKYGDPKVADTIPSFEEFQTTIFNTLHTMPVKKLVFDIRNNPGGSSIEGTDFIMKLSKDSTINIKGKLFAVIGRRTYSSAIILGTFFRRYTKAILVGEETSGKPNHFGELKFFTLPSSKLKVSYSTRQFYLDPLDLPTLRPDIAVQDNYSDYQKGEDSFYNAVLNYK